MKLYSYHNVDKYWKHYAEQNKADIKDSGKEVEKRNMSKILSCLIQVI